MILMIMALRWILVVLLVAAAAGPAAARGGRRWDPVIRWPTGHRVAEESENENATRWAVLVAGSNGFGNYRHQVNYFINSW